MLSNLWRFILTMGLLLAVVVIAPPLIEQTMQAGALAPSPELEAAGSEIQHWTNVLAVILAPLALALLVILRLRSNHSGAGTSGRLHGRHPSVDDSAAPGRITHDQSRSRKVRGSPALMRTAPRRRGVDAPRSCRGSCR